MPDSIKNADYSASQLQSFCSFDFYYSHASPCHFYLGTAQDILSHNGFRLMRSAKHDIIFSQPFYRVISRPAHIKQYDNIGLS